MSPARLVIVAVVTAAAGFGVFLALRSGNALLALFLGVIVGGVIVLTREADPNAPSGDREKKS